MAMTTNTEILNQLKGLRDEVKDIAKQQRENGTELRLLRRELGLDAGGFGRVPTIEADMRRQELRVERVENRVDSLEKNRDTEDGKTKLINGALALLGGSAGAAVIGIIGHLAGFHW